MPPHLHHQGHSHDHDPPAPLAGWAGGYRRVLWVALTMNAALFAIEIAAGVNSGSVSLLADAIDFFGDAANYGLTLAVLSLGMAWRARAAIVKAASMLVFGLLVAARAAWGVYSGIVPEPVTMGVVGTLALVANVSVALLLYRYREGDANMRGVWLCTRNDALGNIAVMLAALGVFGTGTAWPDLLVAAIMSTLAVAAGVSVMKHARRELVGADRAV